MPLRDQHRDGPRSDPYHFGESFMPKVYKHLDLRYGRSNIRDGFRLSDFGAGVAIPGGRGCLHIVDGRPGARVGVIVGS